MPNLPEVITPGDSGHISHHEELHTIHNLPAAAGFILVSDADDSWDGVDAAAATSETVLMADAAALLKVSFGTFMRALRINSGGSEVIRRRINAIAGTGISLALADDAGNSEIDLTITATQPKHGVSAHPSGGQATSSGAPTVVNLGAELYDTDGYHDLVTNNPRLTVPAGLGGLYVVSAHVAIDVVGTSSAHTIAIRKNGSNARATSWSSANFGVALATSLVLVPGDYIEMSIDTSSAAKNIVAGTNGDLTSLEMAWIGA